MPRKWHGFLTLSKIMKRRGGTVTVHSLDFRVFDMVEWEELLTGLRNMGAEEDLVRAIGRELKQHTLEFGLNGGGR